MQNVSVRVETISLPTYGIGTPEKNPIFLEKRVYQGSRGAVYPYPIVEKISDIKEDKEYTAVFLENDYLRIMILPELGGRVQRAFDKVRNRDFIYYNQVVKPALVGLTGPWISGGIEFNWPQHHRPSTFEPVDFTVAENEDGSKTVWVNEVEKMSRTKGAAGFTLYPDRAYLEIKGRLFNRSLFPQTFLWWANPAIKVNEHTQSVFPPDVYAVFDHGKRDVSSFPIATGTYYRVNYAPGTDISHYKNIPVPTSYMAIQSQYNFIGCYEHDTQAGMLHVADHHVSPGKKQWTWGTGDFGAAWERNLTDEDGPYIELMCGVYTDNQPDFAWLGPNEEKSFEQYFLPYAGIGLVKNATKEAAINVTVTDSTVLVQVYATGVFPAAAIQLFVGDTLVSEEQADLSPTQLFQNPMHRRDGTEAQGALSVRVLDAAGKLLVHYNEEAPKTTDMPPAATAAPDPEHVESTELLFLHGLHLEQYRHATYNPADYYNEALRRDPYDVRCNNALGLLLLRRGSFAEAEAHFRKAVERLVHRNPNPYEGEPYYNLGLSLKLQQQYSAAYDAFYKSAWNDACQHKAYFQLAQLAVRNNNISEAFYLIDKSLVRNYHSASARHLKAIILRKLNKPQAAMEVLKSSLELDAFNYGCYFEMALLQEAAGASTEAHATRTHLYHLLRNNFNTLQEYVLDYIHAGLHTEALQWLHEFAAGIVPETTSPLLHYYAGWLHRQLGNEGAARDSFALGAAAPPDYCFPSKIEDIGVLQAAMAANAADGKAPYYLGNFWYANSQPEKAIACWEASVAADATFATPHRNLSLAYFNKQHNMPKALHALQTAFNLDTRDARVLMELDQLYKQTAHSPWQRLQVLEDHIDLVEQRDDLYLERVTLYNLLGDFETAAALLAEHRFHPWEGGEGKVVGQFLVCQVEGAKQAINEGNQSKALRLLAEARTYPPHLGEGKLPGTQENDLDYLQGMAFLKSGDLEQATNAFLNATTGGTELVQAIFYNDPQPDKIFYQGLAWLRLNETEKATAIFNRLIQFAQAHQDDAIRIDYFAVSLPDLQVFDQDLNKRNKIHCLYLEGLGRLGLQQAGEAEALFRAVLSLDGNHQGAITHLNLISFLQQHGY